jgi:uncharacterized membrane-anchored protein YhcB (DUF1043 family)
MSLGKLIRTTLWSFLVLVGLCYTLTKVFKETKLFSWNIPDWIFFLWMMLASLLLSIIIYYLIKNQGMGDERLRRGFEDLKREFADYKTGLSKSVAELDQRLRDQKKIVADAYNKKIYSKTESELEPTEEILFVLRALADNPHGYSPRGDLHTLYEHEFQGPEADEFAAVIGTLLGSKLIRYSEPPINQDGIHLTNEGSKYYLDHKERPKKK